MRSLIAIQRADQAFLTLCLCHRFSADIARVFRWVSRSGDGYFYVVIGLILAFADHVTGLLFFLTALLAFAFEVPLFMVLKRAFRRDRPQHIPSFIVPSDLYSMPSGHTAAAFVMAALLSHFYPEYHMFYWAWASAIGLSRVLLGVHYISDVFAGALLGLGCATVALSISSMY